MYEATLIGYFIRYHYSISELCRYAILDEAPRLLIIIYKVVFTKQASSEGLCWDFSISSWV